MEEFKGLIIEVVLPLMLAFLVLAASIGLPVAWFDGHAKAAYIKQSQGIEIPWYQATFLEVQVNNVTAKVEQKTP